MHRPCVPRPSQIGASALWQHGAPRSCTGNPGGGIAGSVAVATSGDLRAARRVLRLCRPAAPARPALGRRGVLAPRRPPRLRQFRLRPGPALARTAVGGGEVDLAEEGETLWCKLGTAAIGVAVSPPSCGWCRRLGGASRSWAAPVCGSPGALTLRHPQHTGGQFEKGHCWVVPACA